MARRRFTYSFVVARSRNFVIGCDNQLPWRLPSDLRQFKSITIGKPIIMGRRTFDSIGHPLPGRPNIVVSRENGLHGTGVISVSSKTEAMEAAEREAIALGVDEIMIIGGAEIFDLFAEEVARVYLTEIDTLTLVGDAHFERDFSSWNLVSTKRVKKAPGRDQFDFVTTVYEKPAARCVQECPNSARRTDLIPAE